MNPMHALCEAVRDILRAELSLKPEYCDNQPDHRPPPMSGQYYVSIFPNEMSHGGSPDQHFGQDRMYGIGIGVTQRTGVIAEDRMFGELNKADGVIGLFERIDQVIRKSRYGINELATSLLGESFAGKFVEPLRFRGTGLSVKKAGPNHFRAPPCKDGNQKCTDYGAYVIANYGLCRYLESYIDAAKLGIDEMEIELDFIVDEDAVDDTSDEPLVWDTFIPARVVNGRSGGYGAFSSDGKNVAVRTLGDREWCIVNIDGTEREVNHELGGAAMADFMWTKTRNEYFWINGASLELYSLNGVLRESWPLPDLGIDVQWRAGTGSNRDPQFVIAWDRMRDAYWMQAISVADGPGQGFWVRDIPGRTEERFHNVFAAEGYGYGGSLSGPEQGLEWLVSYDGQTITKIPPEGEHHSHEAWNGLETMYYYQTRDSIQVRSYVTGSGVIIDEVSQAQRKEILGVTSFAGGGHIDFRGKGALMSWFNEDKQWSVVYWNRETNQFQVLETGIVRPSPATHHALLPTMDLGNTVGAWHVNDGVRVMSIPQS